MSETDAEPDEVLLVEVDLGPVTLLAPHSSPDQFDGEFGHLWHWPGDGSSLVDLVVAVRRSMLLDQDDVRGHLTAEIDDLADQLPGSSPKSEDTSLSVAGSAASSSASVSGLVTDADPASALVADLVVASDGVRLQLLVRAIGMDTGPGRRATRAVASGIELRAWQLPGPSDQG